METLKENSSNNYFLLHKSDKMRNENEMKMKWKWNENEMKTRALESK